VRSVIEVSRRRFFGFLAAPAIVHAANLMPIKALADDGLLIRGTERFAYSYADVRIGFGYAITRKEIDNAIYQRQFGLFASFNRTKEIFGASILRDECFDN
jgi:hypothetical protein